MINHNLNNHNSNIISYAFLWGTRLRVRLRVRLRIRLRPYRDKLRVRIWLLLNRWKMVLIRFP